MVFIFELLYCDAHEGSPHFLEVFVAGLSENYILVDDGVEVFDL